MKRIAVIVAGGSGSRMGTSLPKQFIELHGRPILMHTLERFANADEIIVVLPEAQLTTWQELVKKHGFTLAHRVVTGGNSRYGSVQNGLRGIGTDAVVAVHDGVRPLVSESLIERCFETAERLGTAIPAITVPDSLRSRSDSDSHAEDRSRFLAVQTPQCFLSKHIEKAYGVADNPSFTDDASVLEAAGIPIHLTDGDRWNIKVTFPEDIRVAEALSRR